MKSRPQLIHRAGALRTTRRTGIASGVEYIASRLNADFGRSAGTPRGERGASGKRRLRSHRFNRSEVWWRMRVLVTGHLGYIGVEMTSVLFALGHDVVGLDTGFFADCDFVGAPDRCPLLDVDLRDVTASTSRASTPSSTSPRSRTTRCRT